MPLETNTIVGEVSSVKGVNGNESPPASDSDVFAYEMNQDLTDGARSVAFAAPGRSSAVVVFVGGLDAKAKVEVLFEDPDGNEIGRRGPSQLMDYSNEDSDGVIGSQIFVETGVPTPYLRVRVENVDGTAASNTCNWSVFCR